MMNMLRVRHGRIGKRRSSGEKGTTATSIIVVATTAPTVITISGALATVMIATQKVQLPPITMSSSIKAAAAVGMTNKNLAEKRKLLKPLRLQRHLQRSQNQK